ncbi:MAG: hypothetical protein AB7O38_18580 [Pirellulaceae bacterium]
MAIRRLIELAGSDDERIALLACDKILERAWGKPRETGGDPSADPACSEFRSAARAAMMQELAELAKPSSLSGTSGDAVRVNNHDVITPTSDRRPRREAPFGMVQQPTEEDCQPGYGDAHHGDYLGSHRWRLQT